MLVIRNPQLRVLARRSLVNSLILHAREVAPEVCAKMSTEQLRSMVDRCLERCEHYGITREFDIFRYLNLMLVFGLDFDKDQPWAAPPLAFRNPAGRMDLLMDHALRQVPQSAGQEHQ
jgi:hypothetical protein